MTVSRLSDFRPPPAAPVDTVWLIAMAVLALTCAVMLIKLCREYEELAWELEHAKGSEAMAHAALFSLLERLDGDQSAA